MAPNNGPRGIPGVYGRNVRLNKLTASAPTMKLPRHPATAERRLARIAVYFGGSG